MKARIVVLDLEFSSSQTSEVIALLGQLITGQAQAAAEQAVPVVAEVAAGIESAAEAVAAHKEIAQAVAKAASIPVAESEPEPPPPMHRNNLPGPKPKAERPEIDWRTSLMSNGPLFKLAETIEHDPQRWAKLQRPLKERLFTHVVRRLLQDGTPSASTFDRLRPVWMPTAGAFSKLFKKGWPGLVGEIRKGTETQAEKIADDRTNGHEARRSL